MKILTESAELEDRFVLPTYKKFPIVVERGEGCYVYDEQGRRYLDMYGGHAVAVLGHCPKPVVDALCAQAKKLLFYSNLVHSRVRAEAARSLVSLCRVPGGRVFFCNSGAEANENAMTIARLLTGRPTIVAMSRSFHGRTAGALAATGIGKYKRPAGGPRTPTGLRERRTAARRRPGLAADFKTVQYGSLKEAAAAVDEHTAAVLVEPIQSMAGVVVPPPGYLEGLAALCRKKGALLVFDEVQTGLGRCGAPTAAEAFGVRPQIYTFAKALGSGVPCGAVLAAPELGELKVGDLGSTFGGGPLACAAILATADEIRSRELWARAAGMEALIRESFRFPRLKEIRGRGLLLGLVFDRPAREVRDALLERGVLVGLSDDPKVVRLLPPLTVGGEEIRALRLALAKALA